MDKAITYFDRALKIDPTCASAHLAKADCLAQMDKKSEAAAEFEKAISLEPTHPSFKGSFAYHLKQRGEVKKAAALFNEALKADPGNISYHTQLEQCYEKMGNKTAASKEDDMVTDCAREQLIGRE